MELNVWDGKYKIQNIPKISENIRIPPKYEFIEYIININFFSSFKTLIFGDPKC